MSSPCYDKDRLSVISFQLSVLPAVEYNPNQVNFFDCLDQMRSGRFGCVFDFQKETPDSMDAPTAWRTTPSKTKVIFLLAVFFTFAGIGFTNDVFDAGRQRPLRLALLVLISGSFAIVYAANGISRRRRFWRTYFLPLLVFQFVVTILLANLLPDPPHAAQLNAAEARRLETRLTLDGAAIISCVVLGYVGFVYASISEGRRFIRTQTEKATLEGEMAAAREVQRVMVPENMPPIRGYMVESVYRPAAEVGGDFFQVMPLKSGRTLIVIGDVSGKGLRAAMIVSMIVGMLRTLSGFTEEPAEILDELSRRLYGHTQGGFATCLAVRLDDGGRLALASAGHLPPYMNGREISLAGSVPLGLVEAACYMQMCMEMNAADRVVLLTDGIPEARDREGTLLGFPRVESLLCDGADVRMIADTAQHFGQNDDMTVISIARTA
jgi:hypothetical protein